jgi:choline dehydrogenase-like flavoprotein
MRALYDSKRQGPYTTAGGNFFAFLSLPTFTNSTEVLLVESEAQSSSEYLAPNTHPTIIAGYSAQRALLNRDFTSTVSATMEFIFGDTIIIPGLQHPFSRGSVRINSTSPFVPPMVDPRYLSNPLDIASLAVAFKFVRTIRATRALQEIDVLEVYPGSGVQSDAEIEEFIRRAVNTLNHHGSTASMLPKEMGGVVDCELKVWGVEGLRVVDASIIPMLPACHLQASVYAIAEKVCQCYRSFMMAV